MTETLDPYAVLGVPPEASPAEIRAAYRRRAAAHHPDHQPLEQRTAAAEQMIQLNAARDLLLNGRQRARYHRDHEAALRWKATQDHWRPPPADSTRPFSAFKFHERQRRQRQTFYRNLALGLVLAGAVFWLGLTVLVNYQGLGTQFQAAVTLARLWFAMTAGMLGTLFLAIFLAALVFGLVQSMRQ